MCYSENSTTWKMDRHEIDMSSIPLDYVFIPQISGKHAGTYYCSGVKESNKFEVSSNLLVAGINRYHQHHNNIFYNKKAVITA